MKRVFNAFCAIFLIAMLVSSCSNSQKLTSKTIVKQVNTILKQKAISQSFATLETGVYECNDEDDRLNLLKYNAAGLVKYNVQRYAWWEKSQKNVSKPYTVTHQGWWSSYSETKYRTVKEDIYNFEDHYVVTVELTHKAKEYIVDELPEPTIQEDKDMKGPDVDPSKYVWNQAEYKELWPEIENPFIERKESNASNKEESHIRDYSSNNEQEQASREQTTKEQRNNNSVERKELAQYKAYNDLSTNSEISYAKTFAIKAVKARNILLVNENGIKRATADVILEIYNASDFGRILYDIENGEKTEISLNLTYYEDKGWIIDNADIENLESLL